MCHVGTQDTGWYDINWDAAGFLDWGYKAGCEFLTNTCTDYAAKYPSQNYFCNAKDKAPTTDGVCTYNSYSRAKCDSTQFAGSCLMKVRGAAVMMHINQACGCLCMLCMQFCRVRFCASLITQGSVPPAAAQRLMSRNSRSHQSYSPTSAPVDSTFALCFWPLHSWPLATRSTASMRSMRRPVACTLATTFLDGQTP